MAAMTSGSIEASSINISPVVEHSEERTGDLTVVQNFLWCKISDTTERRGSFGLDGHKYILTSQCMDCS